MLNNQKKYEEYEYVQLRRFLENIEPLDYSNRKILSYSGQFCDYHYGQVKTLFKREDKWVIKANIPSLLGYYFTLPENFYHKILRLYFDDDDSMIDFFSLFENRYFDSYFYSFVKHDLALNYEDNVRNKGKEKKYLSDLFESIGGRLAQYGGLFSLKTSHVGILKRILEDYFGRTFNLYPEEPDYIPLVVNSCSKLGVNNSKLGDNFLLGKRCIVFGNNIIVEVKAKSEMDFYQLKDDADLKGEINMLIEEYMAYPPNVKIIIKTASSYMPKMKLGKESQLGISCFIPIETESTIFYKVK